MVNEAPEGFEYIKNIGKEDLSKVFLAKKKDTGEKYVIHKIDKNNIYNNKKFRKYLNNEIYILRNVEHKNIIKLYDTKFDKNYFYLIFEYCNGTDLDICLIQYLEKNKKPFPQNIVQHIMKQIIDAFVYLHSNRILHRDIKPKNIFVKFPTEEDKNNINLLKSEIKVGNFHFTRYLKENNLAKTVLGTPYYMCPEILKKLEKENQDSECGYDDKADIWSLGILTYELLFGYPTFYEDSLKEILSKIELEKYEIPINITISKEAISFLK